MDLFGEVRDGMNSEKSERELFKILTAPDVLALSDPIPPWGEITSFQVQTLFRLIDRRYRSGKPILVTMNAVDGEEAEKRLGIQVVDRLRDRAVCLSCQWPSFRKAVSLD